MPCIMPTFLVSMRNNVNQQSSQLIPANLILPPHSFKMSTCRVCQSTSVLRWRCGDVRCAAQVCADCYTHRVIRCDQCAGFWCHSCVAAAERRCCSLCHRVFFFDGECYRPGLDCARCDAFICVACDQAHVGDKIPLQERQASLVCDVCAFDQI